MLSETVWKWRCRASRMGEKKVSDFSDVPDQSGSDTATEDAKKPPVSVGTEAIVKMLYESKDSSPGNYDWVDYPPKQPSKSAIKAQNRAAIMLYKIRDTSKPVIAGRYTLKYQKMDIQSPGLVAALKDIVEKEEVYLEPTDIATFTEPFRALYFRSDDITALRKSTKPTDIALESHLELLLRIMHDMFGETKNRVTRLQASGLVSFDIAWAYFPKDAFVYSHHRHYDSLAKVVDTVYQTDQQSGKAYLRLKCKMIVFNGETFIWKDQDLDISAFRGNKPITDMPHYPLRFHENPEEVKATLATRAKKVLDLQGLTYATYTGLAYYRVMCGMSKHNVDCRILVDFIGYRKHHTEDPAHDPGSSEDAVVPDPNLLEAHDQDQVSINGMAEMELPTELPTRAGRRRQPVKVRPKFQPKHISKKAQEKNKQDMLGIGDELALMSPFIRGYALKNKIWLNFFVDEVRPVEWNDEAYTHLVYDEQQKDLILTFVKNHQSSPKRSDDVIAGKGQGLIVLLSGPPGTGKTLTAEAVADRCRRPLFYLQAEDLGLTATELGTNLKKVFRMAVEWNAVILLDEADVFMAERNPNDIRRNELVSIFLRELEYYSGVIFLTTNLYDTIDGAFRSRVNLHMLFSELSAEARLAVWRKFLERLPPMAGPEAKGAMDELEEEDLKEIAAWQLNGREIKNAVKLVKSWCDYGGYDMTLSRMESGIKVSAPQAPKRDHTLTMDLYT